FQHPPFVDLQPKRGPIQVQLKCGSASALFTSPKQASTIPANPTPNFFSAPRRVTDWANPLASSSNFSFITFISFCLLISSCGLGGSNLDAGWYHRSVDHDCVVQDRTIEGVQDWVVIIKPHHLPFRVVQVVNRL